MWFNWSEVTSLLVQQGLPCTGSPPPLGSSRVVTIKRPLADVWVQARGLGINATRLEPSGGGFFDFLLLKPFLPRYSRFPAFPFRRFGNTFGAVATGHFGYTFFHCFGGKLFTAEAINHDRESKRSWSFNNL
jgi:hypothetical protein